MSARKCVSPGQNCRLRHCKIQSMVRSKHSRLKRAGYRLRGIWAVQVDRINAMTIQNAWRSYVARCLLVVLKRDKVIMTRAVLKLQRIYRGHKIKDWRALKFDMLRVVRAR